MIAAHPLVQPLVFRHDHVRREMLPGPALCVAAQLGPAVRVADEFFQLASEGIGVAKGNQNAADSLLDDFRDSSNASGDAWPAEKHPLEQTQAKAFGFG